MRLLTNSSTGRGTWSGTLLQNPPTHMLALICAFQFTVWTLAPLAINAGLHVNVLSVALWGREWVMLSYKHPNLPGWVFDAIESAFGTSSFITYALAQAFVLATQLFVFLLAVDLLADPSLALAATSLTLGIFFFSAPSTIFNHNIAQMPFWVAFIWLFGRAISSGSPWFWTWSALVAALAMYDKLSSGILLAVAAGWLAIDPRARSSLRTASPYLSALLFAAMTAPLAYALMKPGLQPLTYAEHRAAIHGSQSYGLLGAIALILACPAGILWLSGAVRLRELPGVLWPAARSPPMRFICWFMLLPIGICALLTPVTSIRILWLSPMFSLWGIYLIGNLPRRPSSAHVARIMFVSMAVSLAAMLGYAAFSINRTAMASTPPRWEDWPQQKIAVAMDQRWADAVGTPLRIVAGATHLAGAVAFWSKDEPSFFEKLDPKFNPWISEARIAREGMLIIWRPEDHAEADISKYAAHYVTQVFTTSWSASAVAEPVRFFYMIIPPASRIQYGHSF